MDSYTDRHMVLLYKYAEPHDNGSILINVDEEYHSELVKRLDQLDVMEVLNVAAKPKRTRSCTFLVLEWEFTD